MRGPVLDVRQQVVCSWDGVAGASESTARFNGQPVARNLYRSSVRSFTRADGLTNWLIASIPLVAFEPGNPVLSFSMLCENSGAVPVEARLRFYDGDEYQDPMRTRMTTIPAGDSATLTCPDVRLIDGAPLAQIRAVILGADGPVTMSDPLVTQTPTLPPFFDGGTRDPKALMALYTHTHTHTTS